jgi:tetratricopeptide (TPR) repeat protein
MESCSSARRRWPWLSLLLALCSASSLAQTLPAPAEFYFDEDTAVARPIQTVPASDDAAVEQLLRARARGGRQAEQAVAQLAHLAMASGRVDTGMALYAQALESAQPGSQRQRTLQWNQAWDLYRAGRIEDALALWAQAAEGRLVRPAWVPATFALALWRLDRREEAVAWYAAAVRTWPDRWSSAASLPALLPDWSEEDRAILAEVLAAWRADPPTWP